MIDTDDIKKFIELAEECGVLKEGTNVYGVIRKLKKQYGTDILLDALNFFTELMIKDEFKGDNLIGALVGFCSKAVKYAVVNEHGYSPTVITWAQELDMNGIDAAIQAFKYRSDKVKKIIEHWSDKEIRQEILFLQVIRLEWEAVRKINKTKMEYRKRQIWTSYKKSVRDVPTLLLQSQHDMRIAEYKNGHSSN
jgi:hypothetical protein